MPRHPWDLWRRDDAHGNPGQGEGALVAKRETVGQAIDKAGEFVDDKTQGKYTDTINKVQEEAKKVAGSEGTGDQQS
jgi:hypothetical protein